MSHRLQVLAPEPLDRRIRQAADRSRLSAGAWMRKAIERALQDTDRGDPVDELARLGPLTGDIDQMLAEIATFDDGVGGIRRIALH